MSFSCRNTPSACIMSVYLAAQAVKLRRDRIREDVHKLLPAPSSASLIHCMMLGKMKNIFQKAIKQQTSEAGFHHTIKNYNLIYFIIVLLFAILSLCLKILTFSHNSEFNLMIATFFTIFFLNSGNIFHNFEFFHNSEFKSHNVF